MVMQVIPGFSLPHKNTNKQPPTDWTLLWKSQNQSLKLKHRDWEGHIRRTTGAASLWPHPPLQGWHSASPRWPFGSVVSPVRKRELNQGRHLALPALQDTSQEPYSGPVSWGSLGESAGLHHWGSDRDGDRRWGVQHQHSDLNGPHFYWQQHGNRDPYWGFYQPA